MWFRYKEGWFITIEEKCFLAQPNVFQNETHQIISEMLKKSSKSIKSPLRKKLIEYKGHFIISFEKTNPDDSEYILINNEKHSKDELMNLLRYGSLNIKKTPKIDYFFDEINIDLI